MPDRRSRSPSRRSHGETHRWAHARRSPARSTAATRIGARAGVDHLWQNILVVVEPIGDIIERWTQWDSTFRRPHSVFINPYDPARHVWIVDDYRHAIFKFTHDGKQLVQTLGVPNVSGNDAAHFSRPTFLAWLPDSSMFVADGYANTRVVKFDKDGKYRAGVGTAGQRAQRDASGLS